MVIARNVNEAITSLLENVKKVPFKKIGYYW
jgi:hypothetical protein